MAWAIKTTEVLYGKYGRNNNTQVFNLEMQASDSKELPERARYYQGCIDVDCLKSGQVYKELKNSYVIFICIQDIFKKGRACYSFENLCRENPDIHLNDRTLKYFFIASNCDIILNERQKAFLQVVLGKKPSDKFSKKIEELTEEAKHNTEWRRQYMEWERQRTYDFENGREAKAEEDAINMLKKNYPAADISEVTGLPLEKVLELQKTVLVQA